MLKISAPLLAQYFYRIPVSEDGTELYGAIDLAGGG